MRSSRRKLGEQGNAFVPASLFGPFTSIGEERAADADRVLLEETSPHWKPSNLTEAQPPEAREKNCRNLRARNATFRPAGLRQ